jgi:hypothetical protein
MSDFRFSENSTFTKVVIVARRYSNTTTSHGHLEEGKLAVPMRGRVSGTVTPPPALLGKASITV